MSKPHLVATVTGPTGGCLPQELASRCWLNVGLTAVACTLLFAAVLWILRRKERRRRNRLGTPYLTKHMKDEIRQRLNEDATIVTECLLGVASVVIGLYLLTSQPLISHPFVSTVDDVTGSLSSTAASLSLGRFVFSAFHHVERACLASDASPWLPLRTGYLAGAVVMTTTVLSNGENLFALGALLVMEADVIIELLSQLFYRNASNSTKIRLSVTGCLVSVLTRLLLPPIYCFILVIVCDKNPSDMTRFSILIFVFSAFFAIFAIFMIRQQLTRIIEIRRNSTEVSIPVITSSVELGNSTEWRHINRPRFRPIRGLDERKLLVLRRGGFDHLDPLWRTRSMPQLSGTCRPIHRHRSSELLYARQMLKLLLSANRRRKPVKRWTNLRENNNHQTARTGLPTIHEIPE